MIRIEFVVRDLNSLNKVMDSNFVSMIIALKKSLIFLPKTGCVTKLPKLKL